MKEVGLHHYTFLGLFMDSTSSENSNSVDFDTLRGKFFFAIKKTYSIPMIIVDFCTKHLYILYNHCFERGIAEGRYAKKKILG
jgi:hypothetical protein